MTVGALCVVSFRSGEEIQHITLIILKVPILQSSPMLMSDNPEPREKIRKLLSRYSQAEPVQKVLRTKTPLPSFFEDNPSDIENVIKYVSSDVCQLAEIFCSWRASEMEARFELAEE